jgi:CHAD domain-containing protein
MVSVLEECDNVAAHFSADPVHDLRVALRRCRSVAAGMMAVDPDPEWKAMKKAGRRLFQRLGALRDVQVMMEWVETLFPKETAARVLASAPGEALAVSNLAGNPVQLLLGILRVRESEQKIEARLALAEFDRKQWRQWSQSLPLRASRIRPGSNLFKHLALESWTAARELHNRAMRNRSQVALHALRIGIKRFRYIVENFLPVEHKLWSADLKHMQDVLGEVHDLDVLWATAMASHIFGDEESRKSWHERIVKERSKRVEEYRAKMLGPNSPWVAWRSGLPQGKQIQEIATQRMKFWAKALDPDFAHSERVARLAGELYDGLDALGVTVVGNRNGRTAESEIRPALLVAALLHDVGKSRGNRGHHKTSLDLIKAHGTPLGWTAETMLRAGRVARFHSGALPARNHKLLRDLLPDEQKITILLVAILRLANALDVTHDGVIRRLRVEKPMAQASTESRRSNGFLRKPPALKPNEALIVSAEGYVPGGAIGQAIAAQRYLLEMVLDRPVVVQAMKAAPSSTPQRRVTSASPARPAKKKPAKKKARPSPPPTSIRV